MSLLCSLFVKNRWDFSGSTKVTCSTCATEQNSTTFNFMYCSYRQYTCYQLHRPFRRPTRIMLLFVLSLSLSLSLLSREHETLDCCVLDTCFSSPLNVLDTRGTRANPTIIYYTVNSCLARRAAHYRSYMLARLGFVSL